VSAQADSDKIINKLIKNASRSSSAGNIQVQEFIIVKDMVAKKKAPTVFYKSKIP
jgi:hypothetical protein